MSDSFWESVILLLITATVTGMAVPTIKTFMDHSTFKRRKRFEADLARQERILEAQSKLLDDLSRVLWEFRYLAMAVSYYTPEDAPSRSKEAVKQYDEQAWQSFNQIRVGVSESRRLISEHAYEQLVQFYTEKLVNYDKVVRNVVETGTGHRLLNRYIFETVSNEIDEIIYLIAHEVQLDSRSSGE